MCVCKQDSSMDFLSSIVIRISCSASPSVWFLVFFTSFLHLLAYMHFKLFTILIGPEKIYSVLVQNTLGTPRDLFWCKVFFQLFFLSVLYVALDQENLFLLKCQASRESSIIFLSSWTTKRNSNLQQYLIKRKISCLMPNAFQSGSNFMVTAGLLQVHRIEISGGTSCNYHSRL